MPSRNKWVSFVTAPDQITGEMWCAMLRASGVNCRLRDSNPSFIGPSLYPVRLMAPADQSDIALELLENEVVLGPLNDVSRPPEEPPGDERTDGHHSPKRTLRDEPTV